MDNLRKILPESLDISMACITLIARISAEWGIFMTQPKFSFYLLLTTALCGLLAGCGGDRAASNAVYRGETPQARTGGETYPQNSPLSARMTKLENDMAMMKNDMSQLAMTYNGLMTTNDRIDSLLTKLEEDQAKAPAPVVEKADLMPLVKADTPPPKKTADKPVSLPKETTIMGVRLGEHPDKTRMVLDWSKLGDVRTDLDNAEKLLLITLSETAWDAKAVVAGLSSPLVAGWAVQDDGKGKTLAVQLKKPVKILSVGKLKAEGGKPARVIIDLAAS